MKIALFSDSIIARNKLGLGRYSWDLMAALAGRRGIEKILPVAALGNRDDPWIRELIRSTGLHVLRGGRNWRALAWTCLDWPPLERELPERVDLVHSAETGYAVPTKKPWVTTVHDIGPLTHPELFTASHPWLMARAVRAAAERASAIICISKATRLSLEDWLGLDDLPTRVIHHGISPVFRRPPDPVALEGLNDLPPDGAPFFMFAGSLNPRKNMMRVLRAFERAAEKTPHHLVMTGEPGWDFNTALAELGSMKSRDRVHRVGFVDDRALAALYSEAEALLYPSLMEGFGFPVLEAMSMGCPVITSNVSSMSEVAGEAALLVDPTSVEHIMDSMIRIAEDGELRRGLVKAGIERSGAFTWDRCAAETMEVYESCLGRGAARGGAD